MTDAIRLESVAYSPGPSFAIRDLGLSVPEGAIYGFLGPNGSGKTTTIRLLLGMLAAEAGSIDVLGRPVPDEIPRILQGVGYVPESSHLYPALTVDETLAFHGAFYPTWDAGAASELRRRMGLEGSTRVGSISKGERGKLLILLALAQRPELLVLDEPTDGLDPVVRREVLRAVLDYVSESGATVFISSHLIHELERICDWVGVLDEGRLVAELSMQSFKEGIKRLRVSEAPERMEGAPFVVLDRRRGPELVQGETWIVRGWQDSMRSYFEETTITLREVVDLDLEEGFVELLRSSRPNSEEG